MIPQRAKKNGPRARDDGFKKKKPAAPYFPPYRSIIGAGVLDFRVRNGNGYIHPTMATGIQMPGLNKRGRDLGDEGLRLDGGNKDMARAHDLLVPLGCARRRACTCGLSTR